MTQMLARAAVITLIAVIEAVDDKRLKAKGTWYDYGWTYKAEKLGQDAVGQEYKLTLVESKGVKYVKAAELIEDEEPEPPLVEIATPAAAVQAAAVKAQPAATQAAPKSDRSGPPSEGQLKFVQDLAGPLGISKERMDLICKIRFGKSFAGLAWGEMSLLLDFLGAKEAKEAKRGRS